MRAVLYCRVSSREQVDNFSLPTQEAACRAYCHRQGWRIDRAFIERGESARTTDRPEFLAMLSYCRQQKGLVHYVVVYNLSRFARNQTDHHATRALLFQLGIGLRSVTEPIEDGWQGKLLDGVLAAVHEAENEIRRENTVRGMRAAVEAGKWCWLPPTGYLAEAGFLRPDPRTAPIIREAFRLVAEGSPQEEALRFARARGLTIARSFFFKMLRKPIYAGWIEVPSWGVRVRGQFDPIVEQELWDRAQRALASPGGRLYLMANPDFPLRRFVACGACQRPMTAGFSRGRSRRYGYYRCVNAHCSTPNVRKEVLEEAFVGLLRGLQPSEDYLRAFREVVLDVLNRSRGEAHAHRRVLEAELAELERRRQRLVEAYVYQEAVSREVYESQYDRLSQELAIARMRLADCQIEEIDAEGVLAFAEYLGRHAARLWMEFSAPQKRRFQRFAFPSGRADGAFLNPHRSLLFQRFEDLEAPDGIGGRPPRTAFEPVAFLRELAILRRELGVAA